MSAQRGLTADNLRGGVYCALRGEILGALFFSRARMREHIQKGVFCVNFGTVDFKRIPRSLAADCGE